ncbi:MAG: pyridoxal phosphate-dependent decarboxylase family protein [Rhodoluna sp.]
MAEQNELHLPDLAQQVISAIENLKSSYEDFPIHPSLQSDSNQVSQVLQELTDRLENNFPYFHPSYAAQMLKTPHPVAIAAYLATMIINPNNHSIDASPATTQMEREVLKQMAAMFEYPEEYLGHLTWSGTTANLEALWIARELQPTKKIAHSSDAHYTHSRMSEVLGTTNVSIPTEHDGRMSLDALEDELKKGNIGTIVATMGTTGLGAVDPLADILVLAKAYGARVHVDTAYGGFFKLIAANHLDPETARHYAALKDADSIVVDPHKHGLQPYGSGAVFFKDISIGRFYKHDSPYTYFISDDLHFGEIQLECSRAGASAAAIWATLKIFPLTESGLGSVLLPTRRAATQWYDRLVESEVLVPYQKPELDILTYLPKVASMTKLDEVSHELLVQLGQGDRKEQIHLATYVVKPEQLRARGFDLTEDSNHARILRSVLMKPEHETWVPILHQKVEKKAAELIG